MKIASRIFILAIAHLHRSCFYIFPCGGQSENFCWVGKSPPELTGDNQTRMADEKPHTKRPLAAVAPKLNPYLISLPFNHSQLGTPTARIGCYFPFGGSHGLPGHQGSNCVPACTRRSQVGQASFSHNKTEIREGDLPLQLVQELVFSVAICKVLLLWCRPAGGGQEGVLYDPVLKAVEADHRQPPARPQ